jgi:hypothetical protein
VEHLFTPVIMKILRETYDKDADTVFQASPLIQYLNIKTRSASRGSKARSAFGNHYALYVLVEDYIAKGYLTKGDYSKYDGAAFSALFKRQRELPFGSKLQNHHLNHRLNEEFKKYFPASEFEPIIREVTTKRYWVNENLLKVKIGKKTHNIAPILIKIIDAYVSAKKDAFEDFIKDVERLEHLQVGKPEDVCAFVLGRLSPTVDARIFEIVSYAILKEFYGTQSIFWGWEETDLHQESLVLYKTGRTNANDGGIDFVMKPLGRFFQVTETMDVKKYFLDIDKIQRFPLTFVVKSTEAVETIRERIAAQAKRIYPVAKIVERYMACIEEIINIPLLMERFDDVVRQNALGPVIAEIVLQSRVEFNYPEELDEGEAVAE